MIKDIGTFGSSGTLLLFIIILRLKDFVFIFKYELHAI